MSPPEVDDDSKLEQELVDRGPELSWRMRLAREYQVKLLRHTIWANQLLAQNLDPDPRRWSPMIPERDLVERLRRDERFNKRPHVWGGTAYIRSSPPQLDPYQRPVTDPNGIFYASPGGHLQMTLWEAQNLGRLMFDVNWIRLLLTNPPMEHAHAMGINGRPGYGMMDLLEWLNDNTQYRVPDYVAACIDMYLAGVAIRKGHLVLGSYRGLRPTVEWPAGPCGKPYERRAKRDAAKLEAARKKLEAAQAEGRWNISQERADQIEATQKAERAAAHQAAYERGDIAKFELPEGIDKSKITWSRIGPGGKDLGGDVLYGYDYKGGYLGNRLNGLKDDSGSLPVLGGGAKLGQAFVKAVVRRLTNRTVASQITTGSLGKSEVGLGGHVTGAQWNDFFSNKYGANNVTWAWPKNGGFVYGADNYGTIEQGILFGRIGSESGTFGAPLGSAAETLSLRPGTDFNNFNVYRVNQPIHGVRMGPVAPAFDMPGYGTQYQLPKSVSELINEGCLERVIKH